MVRCSIQNCLIATALVTLSAVTYKAYGPQIEGGQLAVHEGAIQSRLNELDQQHKWQSGHHLKFHNEDHLIPYFKGIKGEFQVKITPQSSSIFGTEPSVSVVSQDMEEKVINGMQILQIYASKFSRGFFVQQCEQTKGDIQIRYIGHDNQVIERQGQWTKTDHLNRCEVRRVRGVKVMEIMISELQENAGLINVTEEKWLLTKDFQLFFGFIIALAALIQLNAIFQRVTMPTHVQVQTKNYEDEFSKIADLLANGDETRTRSSTLTSQASNSAHTSAVSFKTNNSLVSPANKNQVSMFNFGDDNDEELQRQNSPFSIGDDDNYMMNNKQMSEDGGLNQTRQLQPFDSVHIANVLNKILYLTFIPKVNQTFFHSMIFTSASPYLVLAISAMNGGKACYHTSKYILLANCLQFTLELSNNILIGQNWTAVQAISPILTALLIVYPLFKWQDQSKVNMACIVLCNLYLLVASGYTAMFIFEHGNGMQPAWARDKLNVGIGQKWM